MADILKLSRLLNGLNKNVDISSNTLVVQSIKVGGSASNTELTKAIMDNLVTLQNGSDAGSLHNHDTAYYTKTQIGSTGATSGASLVGVNATAVNISPASQDVEAWLSSLDGALATAGATDFLDSVFRISDDGDDTKKIAFQASGITTGTVRTITMPDSDVDLGQIATNTSNIGTNTSNIGTNTTDIGNLQSALGSSTADMGTFTGSVLTDNTSAKVNIQELASYSEATRSIVQKFEWYQLSALDFVTDNTLAPATEVLGDVYVLSATGGTPNANWDGASAGDVVQFDGTVWVATTPTTGMMISVDTETSSLRQWSGTAWSQKYFESTTASTGLTKSGFDIRLADASANNGVSVSSGAFSISLSATPALEFASNLLQVKVDSTGGVGLASVIDRNANGLAVRVDGVTLEDDGNGATAVLRIKAGGISNTHIASDAAIATSKLADATEIAESVTFFGNTNITGAEAETLTDGSNADSLHSHAKVYNSEVAGEAFTSAGGPYAVRYGITDLDTPETAGTVYKADPTEASLIKTGGNKDPFYVIGVAAPASDISATGAIGVVKEGPMTIASHGFAIGEPIWLASNGALTSTIPAEIIGETSVMIGIAKDTNTIEVKIQIFGTY